MAKLISFGKDEKHLFEAFAIIQKGGDQPDGKSVKASIRLEDMIHAASEEGGSIKLALCPCCNQRIAQHDGQRKLKDGQGADFILDRDEFEYLKSCFDRWRVVSAELKRPYAELLDRLDEAKDKSITELQELIKKRDESAIARTA